MTIKVEVHPLLEQPVTGCARCGGDHELVKFLEFTNPPPKYIAWAPCPTNGEPILLGIMPAPDSTEDSK